MNNYFRLILISLIASFSIACSAKIDLSPAFEPNNTPYVALLPVQAPSSIQRERAQYLAQLLKIELEDSGYVVLADDILQRFCKTTNCENGKTALNKRYQVNRFVSFELESISRVNVWAGYYNALTGTVRVEDVAGSQLYQAVHTERESGGLILESGQVIQAVINQARSGDESTIDALSFRFVNSLLAEVPKLQAGSKGAVSRMPISISEIKLSPLREGVAQLCLQGTSGGSVWLSSSLANTKAQLREISAGNYCGVFRFSGPWALSSKLSIELHSPFGDIARQEIDETKLAVNVASVLR